MKWGILGCAIFLNAFANILIKIGVTNKSDKLDISTLLNTAISPAIIGGILLFVLALIAYGYVLTKLNLSIAYPIMTSMGFLIVILVSWLFLREAITLTQVMGFILILSGVWMVAR
jgi:multidrug transporter EmrE-like cation transporter